MSLWNFAETTGTFTQNTYGPYTGWTATGFGVGSNNAPRVLWTNTSGQVSLWANADTFNTTNSFANFGPYPGWTASCFSVAPSNAPQILWVNTSGQVSLWTNADAGTASTDYGPFPGYTPLALTADVSSAPHILWNHPADSTVALWSIAADATYTSHSFPYPAGYTPKALSPYSLYHFSAPGGGNAPQNSYVNLLWANPATGDALIQTLSATGTVIATIPVSHVPGQNVPPVSHGTYTVTYSGGMGMIGSGGVPHAFMQSGGVYSASINVSGGGSISAQCNGPLTATFTWVPDPAYPGSPPPAQVVIAQTCTASWYVGGSPAGFSGSCNSGLGPQDGLLSGVQSDSVTGSSVTAIVQPALQFSLTPACNPSAVIGNPNSQCATCNASITYSASVVNASLTATSTVPLANWDATKPRYFSGTNCSATATAVASTGYVTLAQLIIGGTVVKSYYDTSISGPYPANTIFGTNQASANLTVNFDSTHFADNTNVPIQMTVQNSGGSTDTYSKQIAANTSNKAYVLGNDTIPYSSTLVGDVSKILSQNNYSTNAQPDTSDVKATILQNLPNYSTMYMSTHGNSGIFGDSYYQWHQAYTPSQLLFAANDPTNSLTIPQELLTKASTVPLYNFVYLDACDVSDDSSLAIAFGVNSIPDTAFLGWVGESMDESARKNCDDVLMQDLSIGMTLEQARYLAIHTYPVDSVQTGDHAAVLKIIGDSNMTLHSQVYGSTNGTWFR